MRSRELQVRELPLETRNVVQLLSLQPGVTTNGEVLGARRDQNNITLDGVDVNDNQNAGLVAQNTTTGTTYQGVNGNGANVNSGFNSVLPIPLDSVQEFRVTVAGEGADQGRSVRRPGGAHHQERHQSAARLAIRIQPQHGDIRQHLVQ